MPMQASNLVWISMYIPLVNALLEARPALVKLMEDYQYVLVDEVQDNDRAQYQFVSTVCKRNQNVFFVGDLDQAIYQFRGAEVRALHALCAAITATLSGMIGMMYAMAQKPQGIQCLHPRPPGMTRADLVQTAQLSAAWWRSVQAKLFGTECTQTFPTIKDYGMYENYRSLGSVVQAAEVVACALSTTGGHRRQRPDVMRNGNLPVVFTTAQTEKVCQQTWMRSSSHLSLAI